MKFGASQWQKIKYRILKYLSYLCALLAVAALAGIIIFILTRGASHVTFSFIFGDYTAAAPTIKPAIIGTLYVVGVSVAIAAPIGIATAIFLTEYKINGRMLAVIRVAVETLAGIPSIVYGIFGYIVFCGLLKMGICVLSGGITISIMILPLIIRATEEALLSVPKSYREGSYALGTGKARTIFKVVLPSAAGGIISALILAIGRVISESAVLLLTIGGMLYGTGILGSGTTLALDVYIFGTTGQADAAAATAVVLLVMVFTINILATIAGKLLKRGKV